MDRGRTKKLTYRLRNQRIAIRKGGLFNAFDDDNVRVGGAVSQFFEGSVFRMLKKCFHRFGVGEAKQDKAIGVLVSLEDLMFAAANEIRTPVVSDGGRTSVL